MAIQGRIEEAGLPDVLQLLALGRKTGCLSLADGALTGHIYLDVGRVSYATVANRLDRIGDMLVKSGRITQQQLDEAVADQARTSGRHLGRILVDSGRIDRAELERFIRLQVEEAVYFLFTWKQGVFTFTSDRLPPSQSLLVCLDAEGLLLEGARRVDEWSLIQKKIPSFDLVYRRIRETAAGEGLTEEQKRVLPLLDGSRDVTAIVDITGMSEFDAAKALYGLLTAGFAQLVERRAHVRHLEYRELLAYTVREAEFADPKRRKDAARHIVDCPTCAERLRTINVRRTTGSVPIPPAVSAPAPAAVPVAVGPEPAPAWAPSARPAAPAAGFVERREGERRTGHDRRMGDRRSGVDRRRTVSPGWAQTNVERRVGPRREDDRRSAPPAGRRSGDRSHRGSPASRKSSTRPGVGPGPGRRTTEPRYPQPTVTRDDERPESEGPPVDIVARMELEPLDAGAGVSAPRREGVAPVAAPSMPGPDSAAPRQRPPHGRERSPGSLEWLVSPEESLEMIRVTRAQMRARNGAGGASPPPAPRDVPRPVNHARPPVANGRTLAAGLAAGAGGPKTPPTLDRYAAAPGQARPPGDLRRRGGPDAAPPAFPVKRLAIASGVALVALLGFLAGQLARRGRADQAAESSAVASRTPAAEVREPSPAVESRPPRRLGTSESGSQRPGASSPRQLAQPAGRPAARLPAGPAPQRTAAEPERAQPSAAAPPAAAAQVGPAAPPAVSPQAPPTTGVIRGIVHDAGGRAVPGTRVTVRGTQLSATADAAGSFEIRDVAEGSVTLDARADGFVSGTADVNAKAGATVAADLTLARPPSAAAADAELAAGGWVVVDRAEATSILGGTFGAIQGLAIESIAKSTSGPRARVRVAQLTPGGDRIVLTETRAGAAVRGGTGPVVVTALRVMPPSEAYPWSTATASLGNILITVKTAVAADALRSLLGRLGEVP